MLTRVATEGDAATIAEQRRRMFADSGQADAEAMQTMVANFAVWVRPRLADGTYMGWIVEDVAGRAVAGAGTWLMDFPPHWMDPRPHRAYLLNFYVDPEFRGQGLARRLLELALEEARRMGVRVVSLHASRYGRPLYERNEFVASNEMILRLGRDV